MTSNPYSTDFEYKKYSLENLEKWMHDAIDCEDLTPQDIYDTIVKCVDDSVNFHRKELDKTTKLLSLLKGHRDVDLSDIGEKFPYTCDKDDLSPECKKAWEEFWEGHDEPQYTEEELNAMCDKAASDAEKEKCREYNLREAEYYNKRAELDAHYNFIKENGGYDWTP
jgi:hypothetical protein